MKQFLLLVFFLVAGAAWGQTGGGWETVVSSGPRRAVAGDGLVCGSGVDFDVGEIFRRGFQMAFAPRVFRKNWPLYGYAIPNHQADDSCDLMDERYPDLGVGEAALVLSKPYAAAPGLDSFDYIGFPVESVAVVGSGALAARAGNSADQSSPEHAQLRIREVCRWFREPPLFTQHMLRIDALPYDLPGGVWDNVEFDGNAPSFEPLTLMAGVIGEPDGAGAAPTLTWEEETAESGRRIVWAPVFGDEDLPAGSAVEEGGMWWKYTPAAGQPESRGDYYLSWGGSESDVPFADTTTWSSPSGAMQWMRMPVGGGAAHSRFTMWYAPRQNPENGGMAAAHTDGDWYLLTEEPLPRLAADIRFQYHCMAHTR